MVNWKEAVHCWIRSARATTELPACWIQTVRLPPAHVGTRGAEGSRCPRLALRTLPVWLGRLKIALAKKTGRPEPEITGLDEGPRRRSSRLPEETRGLEAEEEESRGRKSRKDEEVAVCQGQAPGKGSGDVRLWLSEAVSFLRVRAEAMGETGLLGSCPSSTTDPCKSRSLVPQFPQRRHRGDSTRVNQSC